MGEPNIDNDKDLVTGEEVIIGKGGVKGFRGQDVYITKNDNRKIMVVGESKAHWCL